MKKFQSSKVISISSAHFFHDIYTSFLAPMLPLLIEKHGLNLSLVGMLEIVRRIPSLLNPFIGLLADKVCLKYLIIITPALTAITMSLIGIVNSWVWLFILLFVTGISSTLFHIPAPVMIRNFSGDKTATGMSFFMFGGEMARTVGPLLITAALSMWGLEGSYKIMPLGLFASLILYFKLRDLTNVQRKQKQKDKESKKELLKELTPFFAGLSSFLLLRGAMKASLTLYLPVYITQHEGSLWLAGISISVLELSGAISTFGAGIISDKIGHKNLLLITSFFSPLTMFFFLKSDGLMMLPSLLLIGFFLFASGPVLLAMVQETNTQRPAFVNSIFMTINFFFASIMVLVVGFLGDHFGLDLTFKIGMGLAFLAFPLVYFLPNKFFKKG